ncbi:MAG: HEPN family nuclease [Candidatus Thioglobus sp.]|uniref:HEPN family nuclease n=1 Tax=Candidatus Thioglobus sp. TaxID=2026721 RepID=UPI00263951DD|nr:HEPN family nuclease [Candidatus Thioglobus sp.]MDC9727177.1 HEPN family nuclease [Candidatus Thioglobus sp.]
MLSQEDNLLFQSYISVALFAELRSNNFIDSDFFKGMSFGVQAIKKELKNIGVDNQGSALMSLYAMLVIPRELIFEKYPSKVAEINDFLEQNSKNVHTTYRSDQQKVDFLRHIRNSVSHARVTFEPSKSIGFSDQNSRTREQFTSELPLEYFGKFMEKLQEVHLTYIKELQSSQ